MSKLGDVYQEFRAFTGLDWYPDPGKICKNQLWGKAVDEVDEVIAAQAEAIGLAHCTAERQLSAELVPEAEKKFSAFRFWLAENFGDETAESNSDIAFGS